MNGLTDWLGERWVLAQIPDPDFEQLIIQCHTCRKLDPGDMVDPMTRTTRVELAEGGARVIHFPNGYDDETGNARQRWDLCLPFKTYGLWFLHGHLFHLLEAEWDHRWISKRPLWVQSLPERCTLPLTKWGPLPISNRFAKGRQR